MWTPLLDQHWSERYRSGPFVAIELGWGWVALPFVPVELWCFWFFCAFLVQDPTEQTEIDNFMVQQLDGTSNEWGWCKQKVRQRLFIPCSCLSRHCSSSVNCFSFVSLQLGANAILAVSLAVCKAGAAVKAIPLYQVLYHSNFNLSHLKPTQSLELTCVSCVCSTLPILLETRTWCCQCRHLMLSMEDRMQGTN